MTKLRKQTLRASALFALLTIGVWLFADVSDVKPLLLGTMMGMTIFTFTIGVMFK